MTQRPISLSLRIALLNLLIFMPLAWANAQDGTGGAVSSSSTSKTTSSTSTADGWYTAPWVWVVGAAVFVLLLVALLNNRGGRRAN
jgi:hypothetical protein